MNFVGIRKNCRSADASAPLGTNKQLEKKRRREEIDAHIVKQMSKEDLSRIFSIGELVSIDWRLGIALKSSNCPTLNSPYVSLLLKVQDSSKRISSHTLELSLAEFQEFAKNLNDMYQLMESLS